MMFCYRSGGPLCVGWVYSVGGGGVLYPEVGGRRTAGFYGIPSIHDQRKECIAKLLVITCFNVLEE